MTNTTKTLIQQLKLKAKTDNIVQKLIENTKKGEIDWCNYAYLLEYLDEQGIDVSVIPVIRSYLSYVSSNRLRYQNNSSFIVLNNKKIYILCRILGSSEFKLYVSDITDKKHLWSPVLSEQVTLRRLHNLIRMVDTEDTSDSVADFLYSIYSVPV